MVGFDVVRDPDRPVADASVGRAIEDHCRERGVHLQAIQKNRFRILPPLVICEQEIDHFVDVLEDALVALAAGRAHPEPATNPYTAAYHARQAATGLRTAARWAWRHSPQDWTTKLRAAANSARRRKS
jgi:hypothetical protein